MKKIATVLLVFLLLLVACSPKPPLRPGSPLLLASFTENKVEVSISLEQDASGQVYLAAIFAPIEDGFHLYNKDLPREGLNGLGRPTLLELTPDSMMQAAGELTVSLSQGALDEADEWMTYPEGPVTLRLAVILPAGGDWVDDVVSVTYMSCTSSTCNPPIIGRLVPIRVPGREILSNP